MPGTRFTSWLSEEERDALRAAAKRNCTSENSIMRIAIRALLLGKPVPKLSYQERDHEDDNPPTR